MGRWLFLGALALASFSPLRAQAWVITEHERIGEEGIAGLSARHRRTLARAWAEARRHEPWAKLRLCRDMAVRPSTEEAGPSWCASFATLPALAADHACSPDDLRHILAEETWMEGVLAEADELEKLVAAADGNLRKLLDIRLDLDIRLQLADHQYAGRARAGGAHYQMARRSNTLVEHLEDALAPGETSNATMLYATYHAAALAEAGEAAALVAKDLPAREKVVHALLTESFAVHFLEDAFASGHIVGAWGDEAQRKGTHDYYTRYGFDAAPWQGEAYVAHGDNYMTDADARAAAGAVTASLAQLAEVLAPFGGKVDPEDRRRAAQHLASVDRVRTDSHFDACTELTSERSVHRLAAEPFLREVWQLTPRPPRRVPAIPRFRIEFGPFVGISAAGGGSAIWGDDGAEPQGEIRGRLGLGAGYSGDGLFSQIMTGRAFGEFLGAAVYNVSTHEAAAGIGFRVYFPYTFIPGDFIIGLPLALEANLAWMARQAGLGGAHRLNAVVPLSERVRFQFIGGREVAMVWYFPRGQPPFERHWRWETTIPAFQFSFLGEFHQEVGSQWTFDLGAVVSHEEDQPVYAGPYLTGSFYGRYFP